MELIFALTIVFFFVALNQVRVALVGSKDQSSEMYMALSSIVFGFLFAMFV